ncbi:hypothetical protein AVEN_41397-1, partial [Araneus ventricosus]
WYPLHTYSSTFGLVLTATAAGGSTGCPVTPSVLGCWPGQKSHLRRKLGSTVRRMHRLTRWSVLVIFAPLPGKGPMPWPLLK